MIMRRNRTSIKPHDKLPCARRVDQHRRVCIRLFREKRKIQALVSLVYNVVFLPHEQHDCAFGDAIAMDMGTPTMHCQMDSNYMTSCSHICIPCFIMYRLAFTYTHLDILI